MITVEAGKSGWITHDLQKKHAEGYQNTEKADAKIMTETGHDRNNLPGNDFKNHNRQRITGNN